MRDAAMGILMKDEDVFAARARQGFYPPEVVHKVLATRDEILSLADVAAFPFDRDNQISP